MSFPSLTPNERPRLLTWEGDEYVDFGDGAGPVRFDHPPDNFEFIPGNRSGDVWSTDGSGKVLSADPLNPGTWISPSEGSARSVPGVLAGAGSVVQNIAGMGSPSEGRFMRTPSQAVDVSGLDAGDVAVGEAVAQGVGMMAGGAGGSAAGAAMASRGARGAASFLGDLAGSFGATVAMGSGVDEASANLQDDLKVAAAMATAAKVLPMPVRMAMGIAGMRGEKLGSGKIRTVQESGGNAESMEALERLQGRGVELTPGQASGRRSDIQREDAARSSPNQTGPFQDIDEANQRLYDESAARALGIDPIPTTDPLKGADPDIPPAPETFPVLTPERIDQAGDDIAKDITDVVDEVGGVELDSAILGKMRNMIDDPGVEPSTIKAVNGWVDKIEAAADSDKTVKAETWRKIRQKMVKKRRSLTQTDPNDGAALEEVIEEWDELPVRTLERRGGDSQKFLDEYQRAREQYRIYVSLSDGRAVDNNGHVRALSSAAGLKRTFNRTFTGMRDDFMHNPETKDFLRFTKDLTNDRILPSVGNSGTATRMAGQMDIDRGMKIGAEAASGQFGQATGSFLGKLLGENRSKMLLAPEIGPRGEALSRAGALPFLDLLRDEDE